MTLHIPQDQSIRGLHLDILKKIGTLASRMCLESVHMSHSTVIPLENDLLQNALDMHRSQKSFSATAYEKPFSRHDNANSFLTAGACPGCFLIPCASKKVQLESHDA